MFDMIDYMYKCIYDIVAYESSYTMLSPRYPGYPAYPGYPPAPQGYPGYDPYAAQAPWHSIVWYGMV